MLQIWVADEVGQIKSCSVQSRTEEGNPTVSETEVVSSSEGHDRSKYVQIMAHAKWNTPEKTMVLILHFTSLTLGSRLVSLLLVEGDRYRYWILLPGTYCGMDWTNGWKEMICLWH
jgi:hypothetical protein